MSKYSIQNCIPIEPSQEWLKYIQDNYVYDELSGEVKNIKTGKVIGTNCGKGYLKTCLGPIKEFNLGKKNFKLHILAWFLYFGSWPTNEIDHINNIPNDNRIDNLRVVDREENLAKRYRTDKVDEPF